MIQFKKLISPKQQIVSIQTNYGDPCQRRTAGTDGIG
jgi:hypothetical protein